MLGMLGIWPHINISLHRFNSSSFTPHITYITLFPLQEGTLTFILFVCTHCEGKLSLKQRTLTTFFASWQGVLDAYRWGGV